MANDEHFRFVSLLALELENGDISLPSLPDVVMKIRKLLENENCDFERISQAVSVDPVLVSRLFVFANSAYYNRSNIKAETLDAAISRLGFEVVRNTAMSLAMKQLYKTDTRDDVTAKVREVWADSMKLSCMAYAVARNQTGLNHETAYLCGLMHDVGKLYILTKAEDFPELLGEPDSLQSVMNEWNAQISKSIVESWGFPEEVVDSMDPSTSVQQDADEDATFVDVMIAAKALVDANEEQLAALAENESSQRLGIDADAVERIRGRYDEKLETVQQSLS
jgi:HD-like signal output (HDOD) protein